ncbi:hypothetical protein KVG88_30340 [Pseudomonas sp. SWRI74]|jgi:hypothetical protein|uniref:Phage protein n=1 Tax=Pseudomonas azerbaijanoccidentalis TaxID=2842347 RepID=A0ABS6R0M8_9PSED|nr:hypothetical protein [Pseudomonas azerbaijanoccidentalis]MBV4524376.1 hypothetical protein [Pseudomonas azerbaijanoccidentalis]
MLNNVAIQINRANRQRTLREPNAIPCVLFDKKVTRTSDDETADGYPTIGPLGVMSDEDETAYEWVEVGEAMIHFAQGYAAPLGNTSDDSSRMDYAEGVLEASIEPLADPGTEAYVQPGKRMLVAVLMGEGVIINFEIVDVTGNVNIPPYTRKYLLNPRPDEEASEDLNE